MGADNCTHTLLVLVVTSCDNGDGDSLSITDRLAYSVGPIHSRDEFYLFIHKATWVNKRRSIVNQRRLITNEATESRQRCAYMTSTTYNKARGRLQSFKEKKYFLLSRKLGSELFHCNRSRPSWN
jgi:hypothetical protein